MKTILKIFRRDLKKIFTNSMAIILIVGVAVLPSLYAWFNIYANWDPYGNTGNMQVAVINADEGAEIENLSICVGNQIVTNLKANDSIDWKFVSKEEALYGVKSGKYYAAVEIPENFSESLTSIVKSDFVQPKITYYANEKKNAIATKITDKVVATVQTQVNESFVTTVVDVLSEVFGIISDDVSVKDEHLFEQLSNQIDAAKTSINSLEKTVSGFSETAGLIKELCKELNNSEFSSLGIDAGAAVDNTQDAVKSVENSLLSVADSAGVLINSLDREIDIVIASVNEAQDKINAVKNDETINTTLKDIYDKLTVISAQASSASEILSKINSSLPLPISKVDELVAKLDSIADLSNTAAADLDKALKNNKPVDFKNITSKLSSISSKMNSVANDYKKTAVPQINSAVSSLTAALGNASNMISMIDSDKEKMAAILKSLEAATTAGSVSADSFQALLAGVSAELDVLSKNITNLSNNESFNAFLNIIRSNSSEFGAFMACPVTIETDKVYEVENYGSAMAPFYSTLAVWVGGVVLVAIFKTNVKHKNELVNVKPYQEYFGRGLLFVSLAFIQGLIICLGDLLFLGIQCYHPFLFVIAGCFASVVYSFLIYSLTVSFGDIGKAIAVILLVIQIGGSGGTFPIDVTPKFFRTIHPYLPFTYVVNAMRECVCGTFSNDYWLDLLKLSAYIVIALVIGLVIRIPFKKPISFFNKRLEDTDVM